MTALFNLFYLYDPWLFHVVRMSFVAGLAALVVLAYQYIKKQKPQGIILPLDSLAVLGGLIVFSVIPLLLNGTKDLSVITMYVKELILFLLGVGLYNAFYANANGQQRVVRDLQIGVVVQFVVGIIGLLGASFMIDFLLFETQFQINNNVVRPLVAIENPQLVSNLEAIRGSKSNNLVKKLIKYPLKKILAVKKNLGK